MAVNFAGCAGFGYLATKVSGTDTKAAALRGGAIGSAIAHGLQFIGNVVATEAVKGKLTADNALHKFIAKSAGLNCNPEGLAGYIDEQGNYHEAGLNGYIDANGNFIEDGLNANEPELVAYEAYQDENEGLQAQITIDAEGNLVM